MVMLTPNMPASLFIFVGRLVILGVPVRQQEAQLTQP